MIELELSRFAYLPKATIGLLVVPEINFKCYTIEQPWNNNKPFHSCVPEGRYACHPHRGTPSKGHYVMVNPELDVYQYEHEIPTGTSGRYACLLGDTANGANDVQGCVGMGKDIYVYKNYLGVSSSRYTKAEFDNLTCGEEMMRLTIKRWEGDWLGAQ